jgi:hypothetical protein
MTKTITRKQLQTYGMSSYQAATITQNLTPLGKEGRSNTFALTEVIDSIRKRLNIVRLKLSTRNTLGLTINHLLERFGNIVEIPFVQSENPEIQKAGAQLLRAIARTDVALADLQAEALEIESKYKGVP